ncbi:MAG TPA: PIN domain-containing protein [Patescibacteria group bacterium]|nr:PIN domain-containing protein [Patescibacteria group bacterium]
MAKKKSKKTPDKSSRESAILIPPKLMAQFAEEVAKTVVSHLPHPRQRKKTERIENAVFLDTSAIIDGRIFDVISLGILNSTFVVLESILLELKHIADSQDVVKRERGRKGLERLERLKKSRGRKVLVLAESAGQSFGVERLKEVDEKLIEVAKKNNGRVITCDYNLEKKATISGVVAVNVNTLANVLKVIAVPGESLHIKLQHKGKDITQGVGYLDDGTMIVVEHASADLGKEVNVIVSRVIQTSAGRILFAKKI